MQGHIPCEVATDRVAYGLYSKFDFERQMDRNYIEELSSEYKYYFSPLSIKHNFMGKEPLIIRIDNSNLDFLNNNSDRQFIINKVEEAMQTLGG